MTSNPDSGTIRLSAAKAMSFCETGLIANAPSTTVVGREAFPSAMGATLTERRLEFDVGAAAA